MTSSVESKCCPFDIHLKHGAKEILAHDRARAQKLLRGLHPHGPVALWEASTPPSEQATSTEHEKKPIPVKKAAATTLSAAERSIDVTDAGVNYSMDVGVGNPPTNYKLLVDTGSANTWIGAVKRYVPTATSTKTQNSVSITYGSGSFTGTQYEDQVTIGKLIIKKQSIGVASSSRGIREVDGILGLGPVDLSEGSVSGVSRVPTVTNNMYQQSLIGTESIGIHYAPTTKKGEFNGELTFGEADESRHVGDIHYAPITQKSPANRYWGIDQTISYGGHSVILQSSGIVDTGTTLLQLASDAFQAYQKATGAVLDLVTMLLTVSEEQYSKMESLFFRIGGVTYEFTPNAQIWPRSLNKIIGGEDHKIYLVISDLGRNSGSGLDFINGFVFLQRFYTVYDTTNSRVGFANTRFTKVTTN